MARRATAEDKERMNELYLEIGTYAGVARKIGFSASTVKRYIIPNYTPKNQMYVPFEGKILNVKDIKLPKTSKEWYATLQLTEAEQAGCEELRKEI